MATPLDAKQLVSFEELIMSQVVSQDALIRLLIEKGLFTREEFLEMVKQVDHERKRKEDNSA
jgi:site-specific recombinase